MTAEKNATVHQLEWDKRNKTLTIKNLCILMSLAAAAAIVLAVTVSTIFIPSVNGSLNLDGVLQRAGIPVLAILFLLAVSAFVNRHIRTARWILGERPSDDFTSYVTKPVDAEVIDLGDNKWTYNVGGYIFDVRRYQYTTGIFRRKTYCYQITERSGRAGSEITSLSENLFREQPSDQDVILSYISERLDEHTDYFEHV